MVSPDSFDAQEEQRNPTGAAPVANAAQLPTLWYRSRITLDRIDLHDTPPNFHLTPGMPVTADIRVGKQTVVRYMLGKMIPLAKEGMREP